VILKPYGRPVTERLHDHQSAGSPRPRSVTLFLVRHGETDYHAENRYAGRTDLALTDRGQSQAVELGEWAGSAQLSAVASSPLRRARETAEPAARKAGLNVLVDERLAELDFGDADGLTAAEMRDRFGPARAAFEADPYANPLPGGENPRAALARGRAAVDDLADSAGDRILVLTHGTFLRILLCDLLCVPPSAYRRAFPLINNATGAVVRRDRHGHWGLLAWNPPLAAGTETW
jgi:broad specificity phosphatase PhoE